MALYVPMFIALFIALVSVVAIHLFVMDSVDSYSGYGDNGGSFREWTEFEKQKLKL
jgi:hypothetical protein